MKTLLIVIAACMVILISITEHAASTDARLIVSAIIALTLIQASKAI